MMLFFMLGSRVVAPCQVLTVSLVNFTCFAPGDCNERIGSCLTPVLDRSLIRVPHPAQAFRALQDPRVHLIKL